MDKAKENLKILQKNYPGLAIAISTDIPGLANIDVWLFTSKKLGRALQMSLHKYGHKDELDRFQSKLEKFYQQHNEFVADEDDVGDDSNFRPVTGNIRSMWNY